MPSLWVRVPCINATYENVILRLVFTKSSYDHYSVGMTARRPDWAKFWHFGLLFKGLGIFGDILGYFFLKPFFCIFSLIRSFKARFVCYRYFNGTKVVWCRCFGLLWLVNCFGYFFQNLGKFFSIIRSPWWSGARPIQKLPFGVHLRTLFNW